MTFKYNDSSFDSTSENNKYRIYEQLYDPEWEDGTTAKNKKAVPHKPKKATTEIIRELAAEAIGLEAGFNTTYEPSEYEAGWLLDSMHPFFELEYVTDITAQVKGGKEASVYRCTAHHLTGHEFLAAKVYRPRQFRNLRNDKMYREGRRVLKADGRAAKANDDRLQRALNKRSAYGVEVAHTSWLMHEYKTLELLCAAGAAVPQPVAASGNAILMEYIGGPLKAAPTLNEIALEAAEARELFEEVLRNIHLMLQHGYIHGDLSAYNILYWEGDITLIDFPQVTDIEENSNAKFILDRDVKRICEYFQRQGVGCDARATMRHLWDQYQYKHEEDHIAELSRWSES